MDGFRFAGLACGIKKTGRPDLALIVADRPVPAAAVFTTNRIVAAPVVVSRATLAGRAGVRAVVVNSGNANACTGEQGLHDARATAAAVAKVLDCRPEQVLVCSTGVIGAPLPTERLFAALPRAVDALAPGALPAFAEAIMTTDTRPKLRRAEAEIGGRRVRVAGAAKGAGMIHPNMATMLAFVVTDAAVDPDALDIAWHRVCHRTFNAITIDGDTSTNDTAIVLASGEGTPLEGAELDALCGLLEAVAGELARDIVRDAEGGTKLVALTVAAAASHADAAAAAEAIATSPLVKTALHGEDPNWGRIIAAVGRSGAAFDPERLSLSIGGVRVYGDGRWQGPDAEAKAHAAMTAPEFDIRLELGGGESERTLYTCDFGADYVRINADYRS
ncbi:MAG: bifunctional glutamate N-acetyltransferase/amino-acid acetyltransferase ArgJ [Myxococcales bacterium]|nr:bifunctional glutamate N-acetyltransferase/amino-acid acetyltransferase ArgJ [Myxococcales bacterium]